VRRVFFKVTKACSKGKEKGGEKTLRFAGGLKMKERKEREFHSHPERTNGGETRGTAVTNKGEESGKGETQKWEDRF